MNPGNAWRRSGEGEAAAGSGACGAYLARHSAYLDGELTEAERQAHQAHEAQCAACARYAGVLRRGTGLLRELPEIVPASDFHQRLRHRIYHVQDEAVLLPGRNDRRGWLAAAAGFALIAGGTIVIEASDRNTSPAAGDPTAGQAEWQLAGSWTTPSVPVAAPSAPFPAFTGYTPVVVRLPLYQRVSYELLAGE